MSTAVRLVSDLPHQVMSHVRTDVGLESAVLAPVQDPLRRSSGGFLSPAGVLYGVPGGGGDGFRPGWGDHGGSGGSRHADGAAGYRRRKGK